MVESHTCFECDAEFVVMPLEQNNDEAISYCPYCGAVMDPVEEEYFDEGDDSDLDMD